MFIQIYKIKTKNKETDYLVRPIPHSYKSQLDSIFER